MYVCMYISLCSDEDSAAVNPLIAADEDLSSPEESEVTTVTSRTSQFTVKKQPIKLSLSESDEELPSMLCPVQSPLPRVSIPKPKFSPKPLKSALDIELTESEEEGSVPVVMGDEDMEGISTNIPRSRKKKGKEDIFEPPVTETKKKQAGLMLQFDTPLKPQKALAASTEVPKESSQDSVPQTRREKKKKKSKKSRHSKEEESTAMRGEGQDTRNGKTVVSAADPFSAIASLDAWLNSSSNDVVGNMFYRNEQDSHDTRLQSLCSVTLFDPKELTHSMMLYTLNYWCVFI